MNKSLIVAVALFLVTNETIAQETAANNTADCGHTGTKLKESPVKITKGYYAIHRNAEKLNHQPVAVIVHNNAANNHTKGFYAISSKHMQLHKSGKSMIAKTPKRPVAIKGYYSIKPTEVSKPEENLMANASDTLRIAPDEN